MTPFLRNSTTGKSLFDRMKDSQATIKTILCGFLVISGASLIVTAFVL
jgi:hypothetical protein